MGALGSAALTGLPQAVQAAPTAPRFFVAALTPIDSAGAFDPALCHDLLAYLRENGADGVVTLGTTGEFSSFSVQERKKILEFTAKSRGSLELICHVGTPNLPETLELLHHAAGSGAGAALVLPPFYYKNPSVDGLERFFVRVLEAARIPILLYNIPGTSAVPITDELVRRLSGHEKLYGIKDSSGDPERLMSYLKNFPKLKIFTGSPALIEMDLHNGGAGAITGNGNVIPVETAAVFREFRAGRDIKAAQARLNEVSRITGGDIASMKIMLGELGLRESYCRPPLIAPDEEQRAKLKVQLAKLHDLRQAVSKQAVSKL
jgi:4-hydroxy-tetrahydrodipicolinate synthase